MERKGDTVTKPSDRAMRAAREVIDASTYCPTAEEIAIVIDRERRDAAERAIMLFAAATMMLSDEDMDRIIAKAVAGDDDTCYWVAGNEHCPAGHHWRNAERLEQQLADLRRVVMDTAKALDVVNYLSSPTQIFDLVSEAADRLREAAK
jgi:hypothetical protein